MYTNTTLYYLSQLGIVPWIRKENSTDSATKPVAVLLCTPPAMSNKASNLLNHIVTYIKCTYEHIQCRHIEYSTDSSQWKSAISKTSPAAIVSFGLKLDDALHAAHIQCPVLHYPTLEEIIKTPLLKKSMHQALNTISTVIPLH